MHKKAKSCLDLITFENVAEYFLTLSIISLQNYQMLFNMGETGVFIKVEKYTWG